MGGTDLVSVVLDADTSQVAHARRFVRHRLPESVPADIASDLQLVVSELFTNAIEHGVAATVEIGVESTPEYASVCVVSGGMAPAVGPAIDWTISQSDALDGRGLGIVRRLADELIVERDGERFIVTARRALH